MEILGIIALVWVAVIAAAALVGFVIGALNS